MGHNALAKLKRIQEEFVAIVTDRPEVVEYEHKFSAWQGTVHFWVLVIRSFARNRCPVRAAALAYTTLLALVPMIAVAISVSSSLLKKEGEQGMEQLINKMIVQVMPETTQAATMSSDARAIAEQKEIARRLNDFVQNIRSGTLGVTGMILLVAIGIMMLSRVEDTFNDIWGVARGRSWFARIVEYWTALTLGPLLIAFALALTSGDEFEATKDFVAGMPYVGELVVYLIIKLLPFVILSISFALFYQLVPNTRVQWKAALVGGIIGGSLWQLNNIISVMYVSRVVTNSKIYGSLGMVPLFMMGLYLSWLILLFGAQVAYAYQNRRAYFQERKAENISQRGREFVALRLMTLIGQRFENGSKAPPVAEMAESMCIPSRLVSQVMTVLCKSKIAAEVADGENAYIPARPLVSITCKDILDALRAGIGSEIETREDSAREMVREKYQQIRESENRVADHVTLQDLVAEANGRKQIAT